ncbi:MAG: hypothetical protein PHW47_08385 [Lachnospira sp.]|nr:hypothetical protein [Lachnospira sp.]
MGAFSKTIDFSSYKSYPAKVVIATVTDDVGTTALQGVYMFSIGKGGIMPISTGSSSNIKFSYSGSNLTISSVAGYAYGCCARCVIF